MELTGLIQHRDEWAARNFPNSHGGEGAPGDSIIGVVEELGELAHAHLKLKQGIRGTPEEHLENARDALGDLMIYLMGVISFHGNREGDLEAFVKELEMSFQSYLPHEHMDTETAFFKLAGEVGTMADAHERGSKVMWTSRCAAVMYYADQYAQARYWNLRAITHETWQQVSQRDWVADPQGGQA